MSRTMTFNRVLAMGAAILIPLAFRWGLDQLNTAKVVDKISPESQPSPAALPPAQTDENVDPETLKTLSTSPNYDISKTAIVLACRQFLQNKAAVDLVLKDMVSTESDTRERAQRAAKLVVEMTGIESLHDPEGTLRRNGTRNGLGPRIQDEYADQAVRRRRREAMVFNDGGPITQDNIFNNDDGEVVALPSGWVVDEQLAE